MIRDLTDVGRRHVSERPGRALMVITSVALGVAAFLGITSAIATIDAGIASVSDTLTGTADVVVRPALDGAPMPQGTVDAVRATPGVSTVEGLHAVGAVLAAPAGSALMPVIGIDPETTLTGARADTGRLPRGPTEVALSPALADHLRAAPGSTMRIGEQEMAVVGTLLPGAVTSAGGGDVAVVVPDVARDLGAAEPAQVLVSLDDHTDPGSWIDANHRAFAGVVLTDASAFRAPFADVLSSVTMGLDAVSFVSLLLAAYLIHLAFSSAVHQRMATLGTLLALGASRRQVFGVVVVEAVYLGVAGTVLGMAVGLGAAQLLAAFIGGLFGVPLPSLVVPASAVLVGAVAGVTVSLVGAALPAWRARRLAPVAAMARSHPPRPARTVPIIGAALVVGGMALALGGSPGLIGFAPVLVVLGMSMVLPALMPGLASLIRPLGRRLLPGSGDIAVEHLIQERSRSAATASIVATVVAVVLLVGATHSSMAPQFRRFMETQFGADLQVSNGGLGLASRPMPDDLPDRIRSLEGVIEVAPIRYHSAVLPGGGDTVVAAIEPERHFRVSSYLFTAGSEEDGQARLQAGGHVLVPLVVADANGWGVGDRITVDTPGGPASFDVAGIYGAMGDDDATALVIGHRDAEQVFGAAVIGELRVDLAPDYEAEQAIAAIASMEPELRLTFSRGADNVERALRQFNGVYAVLLLVLGVGGLVGVLGIANTMALSVLDRTREIGLLRAIGLHARQVRWMVIAEAIALVAIAIVAAVVVTLPLTLATDSSTTTEMFGLPSSNRYPWAWLVPIFIVGALAAAAAAMAPARRATRLDVVSTLRFD